MRYAVKFATEHQLKAALKEHKDKITLVWSNQYYSTVLETDMTPAELKAIPGVMIVGISHVH